MKHTRVSPGELRGPRADQDRYSALHLDTKHDFITPLMFKQAKNLNRITKVVSDMLSPLPYRRAKFIFLNLITFWHVATMQISDLLRNCMLFHPFLLLLVTLTPSHVLVLHSPNVTYCLSRRPLETHTATERMSPPKSNTCLAHKASVSWWRVLHSSPDLGVLLESGCGR